MGDTMGWVIFAFVVVAALQTAGSLYREHQCPMKPCPQCGRPLCCCQCSHSIGRYEDFNVGEHR